MEFFFVRKFSDFTQISRDLALSLFLHYSIPYGKEYRHSF